MHDTQTPVVAPMCVFACAAGWGNGELSHPLAAAAHAGTLSAGLASLQPPPGPAQAAPLPPKPDPPQPAVPSAACGPRGAAAARDPAINRGCATTAAARQQYGLTGLLPPRQVRAEEGAKASQHFHGCAARDAAAHVNA
jgi:hypothetical protein